MEGKNKRKLAERSRLCRMLFAFVLFAMCLVQTAWAAEPIKISYYYEEVCASCDGTEEFFELYNRVITVEEKKTFEAEISTYNVFMDSCKARYEDAKKELEIPSGTSLPVLIIGEQWISGHETMEARLHDILMNEVNEWQKPADSEETEEIGERKVGNPEFWKAVKAEVEASEEPVILLFSTNGCDDCNAVKSWFEEKKDFLDCQVLEYNIIEKECLNELKAIFTRYQVPEESQKVPAVFWGESYFTGKDEIPAIIEEEMQGDSENQVLLKMLEQAERSQDGTSAERMNIWTLAAAGLLAGFNPCSISMLLMLLTLLLGEKASIWKNGLLYLLGKYAAYISIGFVIFVTASQISNQTMEKIGNVMNVVMGTLFAAAAVFYIMDAIRIYRQDYGNIKTQLPVGLRRMNHNLIKKVSSSGGIMQPFLILMLGIVISFGEFFCTGQIYMASITYLLKDQVKAAVLPFLVYTTAMSIPAVIMILLIQKTRNTETVSDFMFRHLGVIKIFNAVLFILFAVYFFVF